MMPSRGFPEAEYGDRLARAQNLMAAADLSALLLTTEPDVRYFTGFLTRFWESPTRPWFLVVPASGSPVAVIPSIGASLMAKTWLRDIRTWSAPDLEDDGISLLAETLREVAGGRGAVGLPSGLESHLRMPLADLARLGRAVQGIRLVDDAGILRDLRAVKSEAEIAKIRHACQIAGRAFARVPEIARPGVPLSDVFRRFQMLALEEGADWVPYLAGGAGPDGYDDVISPASDKPLAVGDILMLDTGLVWDGYFCDYDRNFAIMSVTPQACDAHRRLIEATAAGRDAAVAGATAADLYNALACALGQKTGAGRLGHGLGMQLTEGLSLIPGDDTVLQAGMVVTLEPGLPTREGRIMVHEENIVIRDGPAEPLSAFAGPDLPVLS